jgi:hypothetical protein
LVDVVLLLTRLRYIPEHLCPIDARYDGLLIELEQYFGSRPTFDSYTGALQNPNKAPCTNIRSLAGRDHGPGDDQHGTFDDGIGHDTLLIEADIDRAGTQDGIRAAQGGLTLYPAAIAFTAELFARQSHLLAGWPDRAELGGRRWDLTMGRGCSTENSPEQ